MDVQQRDLHLLQSICYQPNAWLSNSGQSSKHKQLKKQHSIVLIGWNGDSAVGTESGSGKIADKSVRKSLDEAFKTAKTLHKHFKVDIICSKIGAIFRLFSRYCVIVDYNIYISIYLINISVSVMYLSNSKNVSII